MLNTIEMVAELTKSGMPQQQADAIVRVQASTQDQSLSREYLENRLSTLESRLEAKFEARLGDAKSTIIMWTAGMLVGQTALFLGLIKFFVVTP